MKAGELAEMVPNCENPYVLGIPIRTWVACSEGLPRHLHSLRQQVVTAWQLEHAPIRCRYVPKEEMGIAYQPIRRGMRYGGCFLLTDRTFLVLVFWHPRPYDEVVVLLHELGHTRLHGHPWVDAKKLTDQAFTDRLDVVWPEGHCRAGNFECPTSDQCAEVRR